MNLLSNGAENWHSGDCYSREAFACQVQVGQRIHEKPISTSDYFCEQDADIGKDLKFKLYEDDNIGHQCFMFMRDVGDVSGSDVPYREAEDKCRKLGEGSRV